MAVFERIDLALVQELLRAVTGMGSELQAVSFDNEVAAPDTVPDAQISARFSWWFETKTETDAYTREGRSRTQLREHSKLLHNPDALLFVITPDIQSAQHGSKRWTAWLTRRSASAPSGSASAT